MANEQLNFVPLHFLQWLELTFQNVYLILWPLAYKPLRGFSVSEMEQRILNVTHVSVPVKHFLSLLTSCSTVGSVLGFFHLLQWAALEPLGLGILLFYLVRSLPFLWLLVLQVSAYVGSLLRKNFLTSLTLWTKWGSPSLMVQYPSIRICHHSSHQTLSILAFSPCWTGISDLLREQKSREG